MKESIYEIIKDAMVEGELPRHFSLPTPEEIAGGISFADGASDGINMYHMAHSDRSDEELLLISDAVRAANMRDFELADRLFAMLGRTVSAISAIDDLQRYIYNHKDELKPGNIYDYAVGTIRCTSEKEHVKYALSLLELFKTGENKELREAIKTLGLSDEFTVFSIFSMRKWDDGNDEIFRLAQKVHGWGRIHAVERLEPATDEIKRWMLLDGVHNDVMPAYSALTCWEKSDAETVLMNNPTHEEFEGIRDIILGLLDEGPVQGISLLDNKEEILGKFLEVSETMELNDEDEMGIEAIKDYLTELAENN